MMGISVLNVNLIDIFFFCIHVGEAQHSLTGGWITMRQEVQYLEHHLFAYSTVLSAQLVDTPTQILGESIQPTSKPSAIINICFHFSGPHEIFAQP